MKRSFTNRKIHYLVTILFLLLAFVYSGCKKKKPAEPELPPITTEGKNTFGCRFGNQIWIPGVGFGAKLDVDYDSSELYIHCSRRDLTTSNGADHMFLRFKGITQLGTYNLTSENAELVVTSSVKNYVLNDSGKLTVMFIDKNRHIISGQFSFRLKERDTPVIVEVTDGRFDTVYTDQ